jgi:hypothetical protein
LGRGWCQTSSFAAGACACAGAATFDAGISGAGVGSSVEVGVGSVIGGSGIDGDDALRS